MLLKLGGAAAAESRAVSLLQTAIALNGSLAEPRYELGNLALTKGRNQEAVQQLEAAAKLNPKSSKVHYLLARAYRRLGRAEEASRELQIWKSLKAAEDKTESRESTGESKPTLPEKEPSPGGLFQHPRPD